MSTAERLDTPRTSPGPRKLPAMAWESLVAGAQSMAHGTVHSPRGTSGMHIPLPHQKPLMGGGGWALLPRPCSTGPAFPAKTLSLQDPVPP